MSIVPRWEEQDHISGLRAVFEVGMRLVGRGTALANTENPVSAERGDVRWVWVWAAKFPLPSQVRSNNYWELACTDMIPRDHYIDLIGGKFNQSTAED